jgi:2-desacetyl-2-hydroxyethyl bacteriochlorophyllide A dehydrogenase
MRTVVFTEPYRVCLEDIPIPTLREGEVLVRTRVTSISPGTELLVLSGKLPLIEKGEIAYPLVPGYENCGEVVRLGPGVQDIHEGDLVYCEGNPDFDGLTSCWGGHAEYVRIPATQVFKVPDNVSPEEATFTCLTAIAWHGVQRGRVSLGDSVAIYGQGIIGLLALQIARQAGVDTTIAIDLLDSRLELARSLGASETINASRVEPISRILELTDDQGVDIVIEATGSPQVAGIAPRASRDQGRMVLLGMYSTPITFDYWDLYTREIDILSSRGCGPKETLPAPYYRWTWRNSYEESLRLISSGRIQVSPLITHEFPVEEIDRGYQGLQDAPDQTLKVMLYW